ncbi:hypothetical protein VP01_470g3 [Puccinia sorghi]|uniref:Uncharacterized protein n=1 Tax=Puccinia sorghi TaxID=27349 RepID=A0A0L6UMZ9_9BASI|nr:hypothetical protein VP01_470g3 [Puccinia sorghi]
MLLSISSFGLLALLFLAQSRPAISNFVCNDRSIKDATQGFCLRAVNAKLDAKNPLVLPGISFLLMPATFKKHSDRFKGSDVFTCEGVSIFQRPSEKRFCCNLPNAPKNGFGLSRDLLIKNCIGRDAKKLDEPSP